MGLLHDGIIDPLGFPALLLSNYSAPNASAASPRLCKIASRCPTGEMANAILQALLLGTESSLELSICSEGGEGIAARDGAAALDRAANSSAFPSLD